MNIMYLFFFIIVLAIVFTLIGVLLGVLKPRRVKKRRQFA